MQTHCPQCKTWFRITEDQIRAADGYVRCCICEEIFNIYEVADQTAMTDEHQPSLLDKKSAEPFSDGAHVENFTADSAGERHPDEFQKDAFDFFEKGGNELMPHVVPDELRKSLMPETHSTTATLLWSTGFLLLLVSLFIEYVWFNRDRLIQIAEIQSEVEKLCQNFDCQSISMRDPSKIELVSRNIYSHPSEKGILLVNVTLKNSASFSQPWPVMNINFTDVRGSTVASRHFLPNEYLSQERSRDMQQQDKLRPDSSASITMKIQDPGEQAISYEFDFL